jgi:hypothetical protein
MARSYWPVRVRCVVPLVRVVLRSSRSCPLTCRFPPPSDVYDRELTGSHLHLLEAHAERVSCDKRLRLKLLAILLPLLTR